MADPAGLSPPPPPFGLLIFHLFWPLVLAPTYWKNLFSSLFHFYLVPSPCETKQYNLVIFLECSLSFRDSIFWKKLNQGLYSPGCSRASCVDQGSLELIELLQPLPPSAGSKGLGYYAGLVGASLPICLWGPEIGVTSSSSPPASVVISYLVLFICSCCD